MKSKPKTQDKTIDPQDRRTSPRFQHRVFARYRRTGMFMERKANIGMGGCCFDGEQDFIPGTEVEIIIPLENANAWIPTRAIVLGHTFSNGWMGVRCQFQELEEKKANTLAQWLSDLAAPSLS